MALMKGGVNSWALWGHCRGGGGNPGHWGVGVVFLGTGVVGVIILGTGVWGGGWVMDIPGHWGGGLNPGHWGWGVRSWALVLGGGGTGGGGYILGTGGYSWALLLYSLALCVGVWYRALGGRGSLALGGRGVKSCGLGGWSWCPPVCSRWSRGRVPLGQWEGVWAGPRPSLLLQCATGRSGAVELVRVLGLVVVQPVVLLRAFSRALAGGRRPWEGARRGLP